MNPGLITVGIVVAAIGAIFLIVIIASYISGNQKSSSLSTETVQLARRIHSERGLLNKLENELRAQRHTLSSESLRMRRDLSFTSLRQLHNESRQAGDAWYKSLQSARTSRDAFLTHINRLKRDRRYHATQRSNSSGGKRGYHARTVQYINGSVDALYAALGQLDAEINSMHQELIQYNRNTAYLRDYIGENCGDAGRKWRASVVERSRQRKQLPPGR